MIVSEKQYDLTVYHDKVLMSRTQKETGRILKSENKEKQLVGELPAVSRGV